MRLTRLILCFFLFQSTHFIAQEFKGKVLTESTRFPLSGVNIIHEDSKTGTTTNKLGEFVLKGRFSPNDTITFSYLGYSSKLVTLQNLKKLKYTVFLVQLTQELNEVNVVSDKRNTLRSLIKFETLSSLKKGVHSFAAIAFKDSILVIGGDESIEEDALKKRIVKNPNPLMSLDELINQADGDLSWRHYSGKIQVYDIISDKWRISETKIRNRAYHNAHLNKNKLYILGGKRLVRRGKYEYLDDKIEVIDLKTGLIQLDNVNPHQASSLSSISQRDKLLLAGGSTSENRNGRKNFTDKLHEYNFESGYWYELGVLPKIGNIKGTLIGNHFYTLIWSKNSLGEIHSYNLETENWSLEAKTNIKFESPAVTSIENSIYFFENNRIVTFDIKTKSLKAYPINLATKGANMLGTDETIYIIGGFRETEYSKKPSSGVYKIDLAEFKKTKSKQLNIIKS